MVKKAFHILTLITLFAVRDVMASSIPTPPPPPPMPELHKSEDYGWLSFIASMLNPINLFFSSDAEEVSAAPSTKRQVVPFFLGDIAEGRKFLKKAKTTNDRSGAIVTADDFLSQIRSKQREKGIRVEDTSSSPSFVFQDQRSEPVTIPRSTSEDSLWGFELVDEAIKDTVSPDGELLPPTKLPAQFDGRPKMMAFILTEKPKLRSVAAATEADNGAASSSEAPDLMSELMTALKRKAETGTIREQVIQPKSQFVAHNLKLKRQSHCTTTQVRMRPQLDDQDEGAWEEEWESSSDSDDDYVKPKSFRDQLMSRRRAVESELAVSSSAPTNSVTKVVNFKASEASSASSFTKKPVIRQKRIPRPSGLMAELNRFDNSALKATETDDRSGPALHQETLSEDDPADNLINSLKNSPMLMGTADELDEQLSSMDLRTSYVFLAPAPNDWDDEDSDW